MKEIKKFLSFLFVETKKIRKQKRDGVSEEEIAKKYATDFMDGKDTTLDSFQKNFLKDLEK